MPLISPLRLSLMVPASLRAISVNTDLSSTAHNIMTGRAIAAQIKQQTCIRRDTRQGQQSGDDSMGSEAGCSGIYFSSGLLAEMTYGQAKSLAMQFWLCCTIQCLVWRSNQIVTK